MVTCPPGTRLDVKPDPRALGQGRMHMRLVVLYSSGGTGQLQQVGATDSIEVSWQPTRPSYYWVRGPDASAAGTRLYMSCGLVEPSSSLKEPVANAESWSGRAEVQMPSSKE